MGFSIKHKMLTLHKVLPPENRPVNEVSREKGISVQTIYKKHSINTVFLVLWK